MLRVGRRDDIGPVAATALARSDSVGRVKHGGSDVVEVPWRGRTRSVRVVGAAMLAAVLTVSCSGSDDGIDGEPVIEVGAQGPGTCLAVPLDQGPEISSLPVTDCGESHSHEIYSVPVLDDEAYPVYPGFDELESFAQAACLRDFEAYVGISAFDSDLFYSWIVPTLTSWDKENDREVLCVAGNSNGAPLVGTVRNSER